MRKHGDPFHGSTSDDWEFVLDMERKQCAQCAHRGEENEGYSTGCTQGVGMQLLNRSEAEGVFWKTNRRNGMTCTHWRQAAPDPQRNQHRPGPGQEELEFDL